MAYEQRDDSGSLFRNDRKVQYNHPDYAGKALIGGVEYYISSWIKVSGSGAKFMSLAFTPVEQAKNPLRKSGSARGQVEEDDDVPF